MQYLKKQVFSLAGNPIEKDMSYTETIFKANDFLNEAVAWLERVKRPTGKLLNKFRTRVLPKCFNNFRTEVVLISIVGLARSF